MPTLLLRVGVLLAALGCGSDPLPRFIDTHTVALSGLTKISRFRSGIGHDYSKASDESCRSMKQYLVPVAGTRPEVVSPVTGKVERVLDAAGDSQLWISAADQPGIEIRVFHVDTSTAGLKQGDTVAAGARLGVLSG